MRSGYRSEEVNGFGNRNGLNCASNEASRAGHIWDRRDPAEGCMGATACIVIPWFADRYAETGDWRPLAWFVHDRLPYSRLCFFPKLAAFNIQWHERPARRIDSYAAPKGCLTRIRACRASTTISRGKLRRVPAENVGADGHAAFRSRARSCGRWRSMSGPRGTIPVGLMCFMSA